MPLRFHSREDKDHDLIVASIPGLDTEELKLEIGEDSASLRIEGLRVPTHQEATLMQQKITARLVTLARHQPQQFARIQGSLDEAVDRAYAEMG